MERVCRESIPTSTSDLPGHQNFIKDAEDLFAKIYLEVRPVY